MIIYIDKPQGTGAMNMGREVVGDRVGGEAKLDRKSVV